MSSVATPSVVRRMWAKEWSGLAAGNEKKSGGRGGGGVGGVPGQERRGGAVWDQVNAKIGPGRQHHVGHGAGVLTAVEEHDPPRQGCGCVAGVAGLESTDPTRGIVDGEEPDL